MKRSSYKFYKKHNSTRRSKYRKNNRHTVRKYKGGKFYMITDNKKRTYKFKGTITNINKYDKYDEKTAKMLINTVISKHHLTNKALNFGSLSLETILKNMILVEWANYDKENKDKIPINLLIRSANNVCARESINDALNYIITFIHDKKVRLEDDLKSKYYNDYIPFMKEMNMNKIPINTLNTTSDIDTDPIRYIPSIKIGRYINIATIISIGWMHTNAEWFQPNNWHTNKVYPTEIKDTMKYRMLCGISNNKKGSMPEPEAKAYGNKMIAELLGSDSEYKK